MKLQTTLQVTGFYRFEFTLFGYIKAPFTDVAVNFIDKTGVAPVAPEIRKTVSVLINNTQAEFIID